MIAWFSFRCCETDGTAAGMDVDGRNMVLEALRAAHHSPAGQRMRRFVF